MTLRSRENRNAALACIADTVAVRVGLIRVCDADAIVVTIVDAVAVRIRQRQRVLVEERPRAFGGVQDTLLVDDGRSASLCCAVFALRMASHFIGWRWNIAQASSGTLKPRLFW